MDGNHEHFPTAVRTLIRESPPWADHKQMTDTIEKQ